MSNPCLETHHQTHSLLEYDEETQTALYKVVKGYKAGVVMVGQVVVDFQAKLKALEAQKAELFLPIICFHSRLLSVTGICNLLL